MAGEWVETTLGSVADFLSGGTPPKNRADYWGGSIPWVTAKDMKRFRLEDTEDHVTRDGAANGTKVVPSGTVFLLVRGMTLLNELPICVAGQSMAFNQDVKALRPRPGVRNEFLPYLLLGHKERLLSSVDLAGHGTGRLNSDEIKGLAVRLPPEPEQSAIAKILAALDDRIELNRRMSETLEAMARALFQSWFVDFDTARAKVKGRHPGLHNLLADIFPAHLIRYKFGEIPEGWEVGSLASISVLNPEVWTKRSRPAQIRYVDLSNTKWGRIEEIKSYAVADAPSRAQRVLRIGDTIIGTVRPGNGSYALVSENGLTGSTGFAVLRPKSKDFTEFIYLAATCRENVDALARLADGGVYPAVRPEVISDTPCVIPSNNVLKAFSHLTGTLLAKLANNQIESRTLTALRDLLLPKLISGELRLGEPDSFLAGG